MARRTKNAETAADLTAETFAAALAGRAGFKATGGAPAVAWLFGIARNTLAASHRRHAVATDARRRLQMQRTELPEQIVDALPETHAAAIRAHIIDDRDYADIALELEASGVAVRQHVSRGLAALRRLVSQP